MLHCLQINDRKFPSDVSLLRLTLTPLLPNVTKVVMYARIPLLNRIGGFEEKVGHVGFLRVVIGGGEVGAVNQK